MTNNIKVLSVSGGFVPLHPTQSVAVPLDPDIDRFMLNTCHMSPHFVRKFTPMAAALASSSTYAAAI